MPILEKNSGNTAIINIHSALSWYAGAGIYSATKAALWSVTNSLRLDLLPAGIHVMGVHMGFVDTPMAAHADAPKLAPEDLVNQVFDSLAAGNYEILADSTAKHFRAGLSGALEDLYPQLAKKES